MLAHEYLVGALPVQFGGLVALMRRASSPVPSPRRVIGQRQTGLVGHLGDDLIP